MLAFRQRCENKNPAVGAGFSTRPPVGQLIPQFANTDSYSSIPATRKSCSNRIEYLCLVPGSKLSIFVPTLDYWWIRVMIINKTIRISTRVTAILWITGRIASEIQDTGIKAV